ncbi:MAG: hypothetical protein ITD33_05620 [Nitrosarchaeum sp.]|jgi:hypothetical protein|nr:hypothetical protein [Nitrosarchaeum sp.]MBP0120313.1 hypothetical protein [Nitrosarchaeum sp.]MBP0134468.1 hypothetical protein [Nitrosarchaeum sp.]MDW7642005.1 hypothetical protein [Nitrosarchaeum sp.]
MNCKRCHHTDEAHIPTKDTKSLMGVGKCKIPNCTCQQYLDPIQEIDEELM